MRSWLTWVTNRPRTTLALVAAVTLGLLASLSRLHIETDGYAFVPTSHRVVRRDRILRQLFDLRDPLVVVLDGAAPGSALRCSFLRRLTRLTESIRTGPDVDPG